MLPMTPMASRTAKATPCQKERKITDWTDCQKEQTVTSVPWRRRIWVSDRMGVECQQWPRKTQRERTVPAKRRYYRLYRCRDTLKYSYFCTNWHSEFTDLLMVTNCLHCTYSVTREWWLLSPLGAWWSRTGDSYVYRIVETASRTLCLWGSNYTLASLYASVCPRYR